MKVLGIDGCKKGWFTIEIEDKHWKTHIYKNISDLWLEHGDSDYIIIDVPIGMRKREKLERKCDLEARKILGLGRGSSVFPVPCRAAVGASTYEDAHMINKENVGRGLSKQTWGIIPKIKEVDHIIINDHIARKKFWESHPEVAFWALNGNKSLLYNKKSDDGIRERLNILTMYEARAYEIYDRTLNKYLRKDVSKDDIVDALCMAITGLFVGANKYKTVPQLVEIDNEGIEMKIVHFGGETTLL